MVKNIKWLFLSVDAWIRIGGGNHLDVLSLLKLRPPREVALCTVRTLRELLTLVPPRPLLGRLLLFPGRYPLLPPGRLLLFPGLYPLLPPGRLLLFPGLYPLLSPGWWLLFPGW